MSLCWFNKIFNWKSFTSNEYHNYASNIFKCRYIYVVVSRTACLVWLSSLTLYCCWWWANGFAYIAIVINLNACICTYRLLVNNPLDLSLDLCWPGTCSILDHLVGLDWHVIAMCLHCRKLCCTGVFLKLHDDVWSRSSVCLCESMPPAIEQETVLNYERLLW